MFQVIFNQISAREMAELPKALQLELLGAFQQLPTDPKQIDIAKFGLIEREGKKLHRLRARDHRIYFEHTPDGIVVHRVLHKNTIADFLFRTKLPMAEDEQLGKASGFWELIREGQDSSKK